MKYKSGIIIFSSINWSTHNQLHHELTNYFSKNGHKILFVENTGTRSITIYDYKRILHRIKKWFGSNLGFTNTNSNITIFTPFFLPFQFINIFVKINSFLIYNSIKKWIHYNNASPLIIISFLPNPITFNICKNIENKILIYYCADDMISNSNKVKILKNTEQDLIKISDLIFYTSNKLGEKFNGFRDKSFLIRNGVNFAKFNKNINEKIYPEFYSHEDTIIGYVGAIRTILDFKSLYEISSNFPNYKLVLIGPIYPQVYKDKYFIKLKVKKNVLFLGSIDHELIPKYMSTFDLAIIPYIKNDVTDSIYPIKLNEYLSQGLKVLSSNINEINNISKENKNILLQYNDEKDCIKKIRNLIKNETDQNFEERIKFAENNDWQQKFNFVDETISKISSQFQSNDQSFKDQLKTNYIKFKNFFKYSLGIFLLYIILFYSPFFPIIGKNLIHEDSKEYFNRNIIAFVGSGEPEYNNFSYRIRAKEILKHYNNELTKTVTLISGRQKEIADIDVLAAYLISMGIKSNKLIIPEKLPSSTYEGVKIAYEKIKNIKDEDFIILTSPYHSKRLMLTFRKNFSNLSVLFPKFENYEELNYFYGMPYEEVKVIIYEFLALIHNKFNNRI